ncbi:DUF1349 domain-containing protein [Ancylobacter sp.]|uniref:DUF1349 domain-containing protein n=1 Tax=Ancylobacter sp. TaxID=1872567 RepID=UPI003D12CC71
MIDLSTGQWVNEPATWSLAADTVHLTTDAATDFWRETHYGFVRDNGHFLGFTTGEAFTAEVRVQADYQSLYDQAGLMLRLDETRWVKASVEFNDGHHCFSVVVTDGRSDWSVTAVDGDAADIRLRLTVKDGALRVQASTDGTTWPLLRLAPFPVAPSYQVGPMACTPERGGLEVAFSEFRLLPPTERDLHDLS